MFDPQSTSTYSKRQMRQRLVHSGYSSYTPPSFLGVNPATLISGPLAGLKVLRFEAEYGLTLALSFIEEERKLAVESQALPMDILSAPYNKNADGEFI